MNKILILCPLDIRNTELVLGQINQEVKVDSNIFTTGMAYQILKAHNKSISFVDLYLGVSKDETLKIDFKNSDKMFCVGLLEKNIQVDEVWVIFENSLKGQEIAVKLDESNRFFTTFNSNITKRFTSLEELKQAIQKKMGEEVCNIMKNN